MTDGGSDLPFIDQDLPEGSHESILPLDRGMNENGPAIGSAGRRMNDALLDLSV
jgi:hypothetical protein